MDEENNALLVRSTSDPAQQAARAHVLRVLPSQMRELGKIAFVHGHIIGDDRKTGVSPFGHGTDAIVAVAKLLRVAASLLEGCASLLGQHNNYASSALSRQLVEIEYLTWTFNHEPESASSWLRSDKEQRMKFFSPARMRQRSDGWFKKSDYANHCELGGHPVPNSEVLLQENELTSQVVMADCAMHSRNIFFYASTFLGEHGLPVDLANNEAKKALDDWWQIEEIKHLPPTPEIST